MGKGKMSTKGMMKGGKGMMKAGGKGMMGKAGMMMGAMMGMGNDQKGKLAMPPVPAIPSVPTADSSSDLDSCAATRTSHLHFSDRREQRSQH